MRSVRRSTTARRDSASHVTRQPGRPRRRRAQSERRHGGSARNSRRFTARIRPERRAESRYGGSHEPSGACSRAGYVDRAYGTWSGCARRSPARPTTSRARSPQARWTPGPHEAPHVRGRGARPLLRAPRLRDDRSALRRSTLRARRRPSEQLVVNWQAPAARPFYTATPQDPHGLTLRRRFRTEGRRLLDIADETLDGRCRRRRGRRLPAGRARAQPRRAHARHRRDDPGRPVPADHARP